jgi:hypothetical protein
MAKKKKDRQYNGQKEEVCACYDYGKSHGLVAGFVEYYIVICYIIL